MYKCHPPPQTIRENASGRSLVPVRTRSRSLPRCALVLHMECVWMYYSSVRPTYDRSSLNQSGTALISKSPFQTKTKSQTGGLILAFGQVHPQTTPPATLQRLEPSLEIHVDRMHALARTQACQKWSCLPLPFGTKTTILYRFSPGKVLPICTEALLGESSLARVRSGSLPIRCGRFRTQALSHISS